MLGCHYCSPARERIASMQKRAISDETIIDTFVKEIGMVALAVPPAEGFNLLAWVMPLLARSRPDRPRLVLQASRRPAPAGSAPEPAMREVPHSRIESETGGL